jgi:hypothetical protein
MESNFIERRGILEKNNKCIGEDIMLINDVSDKYLIDRISYYHQRMDAFDIMHKANKIQISIFKLDRSYGNFVFNQMEKFFFSFNISV